VETASTTCPSLPPADPENPCPGAFPDQYTRVTAASILDVAVLACVRGL
jgi:hypothetical protein